MRKMYLVLAACAAAIPAYAQTQSKPETSGASSAALTNEEFVNKAAIGDLYEIQSSQLSLDKSPGKDFQQFAKTIIEDHTKSSEQLKSIAKLLEIEAPAQLDAKHKSMINKLQSASASEFFELYRGQQIDAHTEAIELYQQYSQSGTNAELRQFADNTLPKLKSHLQIAQSLTGETANVSQAPTSTQPGQSQKSPAEASQNKAIGSLGPDHILSSELSDTDVYASSGEEIGEVEDVVLDRQGNTVALIVSVGGFLGLGEKNVAIPFDAVEIATRSDQATRDSSNQQSQAKLAEPNRIVLRGMSREELESAPAFDLDD